MRMLKTVTLLDFFVENVITFFSGFFEVKSSKNVFSFYAPWSWNSLLMENDKKKV